MWASKARFDRGTVAAVTPASQAAEAAVGHANQKDALSGDLLVTAIMVAKEDGTAEATAALQLFPCPTSIQVQGTRGFQDCSTLLWAADNV
jgi:hypothetical protein